MRRWAGIVAVFILMLAIKPGLDAFSLRCGPAVSCCSEIGIPLAAMESPDEHSAKGTCAGKTCNPFQACGGCVLDCLRSNFDLVPDSTFLWGKLFSYLPGFILQYAADVWQPPKLNR